MRLINDIKKLIEDAKIDIERSLRDEEVAGTFDELWQEEMKIKQDIINDIETIVFKYNK